MPRKQRFKPTRKPKPVATNEAMNEATSGDDLIGHRVSSDHDHAPPRGTSEAREPERASHASEHAREHAREHDRSA